VLALAYLFIPLIPVILGKDQIGVVKFSRLLNASSILNKKHIAKQEKKSGSTDYREERKTKGGGASLRMYVAVNKEHTLHRSVRQKPSKAVLVLIGFLHIIDVSSLLIELPPGQKIVCHNR
jgi:hypothetical protein